MAGNVQIAIKDKQTAKQWLAMVEDINTDYLKAMTDAAETLVNMKDFADGTLVDEFVKYGDNLMKAAQQTFDGIKTIADSVTTILNTVEAFMENTVGGIGKLAMKILI